MNAPPRPRTILWNFNHRKCALWACIGALIQNVRSTAVTRDTIHHKFTDIFHRSLHRWGIDHKLLSATASQSYIWDCFPISFSPGQHEKKSPHAAHVVNRFQSNLRQTSPGIARVLSTDSRGTRYCSKWIMVVMSALVDSDSLCSGSWQMAGPFLPRHPHFGVSCSRPSTSERSNIDLGELPTGPSLHPPPYPRHSGR